MFNKYLSEETLCQTLVVVGVSTSQQEQIQIAIRNISISPYPKEYLKVSSDHPCQMVKDTKNSCTTFDGDHPLQQDIEESLTFLVEYVRIN